MSKTKPVPGYVPALDTRETQKAIDAIKIIFSQKLCEALNLRRVSAPLFVEAGSGINDDLNGTERPVSFDIAATGRDAQVVHSLAKWKRYALYKYGFAVGEGLYTDMNAIRRDEELDNLHSVYTDQWDWEKVITAEDRTEDYLKDTVRREVAAMCDTLDELKGRFKGITTELEREVSFVTTQQLEDMYPELAPKERENEFLKKHHTAFIMKIGAALASGIKHDGRAPDYDDWELNGDIVFYSPLFDAAFEVSSMGIRVDAAALKKQLRSAGAEDREKLMFHRMLADGTLPLSIGGGIGQSRLCMLMLGKAHIGEVQVSVWDDYTLRICGEAGIPLL